MYEFDFKIVNMFSKVCGFYVEYEKVSPHAVQVVVRFGALCPAKDCISGVHLMHACYLAYTFKSMLVCRQYAWM
jgi:hypothetical protein